MNKIEKINHFSFFVVKHIVRKGMDNWKISEVVTDSEVSRSWVYKYFGKAKEEILYQAVTNMLNTVFLQTPEMIELHKTHGRVAVYRAIRENLQQFPEVSTFYLAYYNSKCEIGELLRTKELEYIKNLVGPLNGLNNDFQIAFIRALQHGIALSYSLDDEQYIAMMEFVTNDQFLGFVRGFEDKASFKLSK